MDIISHGLWGSLVFGRKNKLTFLIAFLIGIAPDLFSFGFYTLLTWLGIEQRLDWASGVPPMSLIPAYIHLLYNITHSLIIFIIIFALVWLIARKPVWIMLAWLLHIIIDIFSHSLEFFPTPFLWPLSDYVFNGIMWGNPYIFFPNWILLLILFIHFSLSKLRHKA